MKLNIFVQNVHVTPQKIQETETSRYQCLWSGCKVYSTCSTSFTWLSQHVTKHVAFVCIVPGCRQRFGNQVRIEFILHRQNTNFCFRFPSPDMSILISKLLEDHQQHPTTTTTRRNRATATTAVLSSSTSEKHEENCGVE